MTLTLWILGTLFLATALTYGYAYRATRHGNDGHLTTQQWRTAASRGLTWAAAAAVIAFGIWLLTI